jgi:hypothetical protein
MFKSEENIIDSPPVYEKQYAQLYVVVRDEGMQYKTRKIAGCQVKNRMQICMKSGPKKGRKSSPQDQCLFILYIRADNFVLTATMVSPLCTTFHEIAKEPLSKRNG